MNKKAKQLRELRNRIIYNGDVPLEKFCEIQSDDIIHTIQYANDALVRFTIQESSTPRFRFDDLVEAGEYKILGKPTTWGDFMEILKKLKLNWVIDNGVLRIFDNEYDDEPLSIELDTSRSPEEQDEEVLDKLLEIIK